jgi:hypothetical protein
VTLRIISPDAARLIEFTEAASGAESRAAVGALHCVETSLDTAMRKEA